VFDFDFDTPIDRAGTHSVKYDLREAKFGRADVLPLWVADMDFAAPPCVQAALAARVAHPVYGYTVAPQAAFEAIADWQRRRHGWDIERDWITLTPGLVPSLALAVQAFTQPGEAVVVPTPVYNPLFEAVQRNGRDLIRSPLAWDGARHAMDLEALAARITPDTRLLLLCSPHNPGGRVWTRDELEALGALCERHDLLVVSDEIHADLVYPGAKYIPLASVSPELAARTVTFNSPGKTFNVAGLNTSYAIISDAHLRARYRQALHALHVEGVNLFGLTAMQAAYREGEPWLEALLAYLRGNIELACGYIAANLPRAQCAAPESTFLLWLDCRALGLSDAALRARLVDAGLGLSPGTQFGLEGGGFMRMNIALSRSRLREALNRLAKALSD
jgi:cystathionine beta-lyase